MLRYLSPAIVAIGIGAQAHAQSGTWANTAGGTWSTAGNWSGSNIANGTDATADFSAIDIPAGNTTVNLDSSRTIGNLIFGDTSTSTAGSWVLANNGVAANVLTLASSGTPTITVNALGTNATATISANIAGTNGLSKAGAGMLVLSGSNTYSGGTFITTGTLGVGNSAALGTGAVTVSTGARLQLQSSVVLANNITLNGTGGLFVNSGSSTLNGSVTLQTASTINNQTSNNNGLILASDLNLGSNLLTIANGGGSSSVTINGIITGDASSGITKSAGALLTINSNNTATYSGTTTLSNSTLALGNDGALGTGTFAFGTNDNPVAIRSTDTTAHTFSNALVVLGNANSTFTFGSASSSVNGNLKFSYTGSVSLGTAARKFQVNNRTEFDAAFAGTGGITMQTNTGTLVLGGANTYTGATTVNAGTLLINGSLSTSSAVAVNANGTLGGAGGSMGAVTVASAGSLAPGDGGIGTLSATAVSLQAGSNLKLELNTTAVTADRLNVSGAFNLAASEDTVLQLSLVGTDSVLAGTTFTLVSYGSWNGSRFTYNGSVLADDSVITLGVNQYTFSYNGVDGATNAVTLTAVPEPSVVALGGLGLFSLYLLRRRKALKA